MVCTATRRILLGEAPRDLATGSIRAAMLVDNQDLEVRVSLPANQGEEQLARFSSSSRRRVAETSGGSGLLEAAECGQERLYHLSTISITSRRIGQIATIDA